MGFYNKPSITLFIQIKKKKQVRHRKQNKYQSSLWKTYFVYLMLNCNTFS